MSEGALKPEKDFSKEADKQIPEAEQLASVRQPTNTTTTGSPLTMEL